ncbi:crossover junction endodeoxyribonuclease RuvC [Myxococcota bacterium]|nr:crossover junction endodeoxyribonuclease RuvC [Myxococcota bacterium]
MCWLGLDPGSRKAGYAILEMGNDGRPRYRECGLITASGDQLALRLLEIGRGLQEVLDEYHPVAAAVEDIFTAKNSHSALVLGQARGMVLFVLAAAGVEVVTYTPGHVKKAITGQGRAAKQQVRRNMMHLLHLQSEPAEDAADALALAFCHSMHARRGGVS